MLANVAYLCLLPLDKIQHAPDDRVATAAIEVVFSGAGAVIMAVAIMVSTFGCNNGLILAGARVYYAMARDGLFFKRAGKLNAAACRPPGWCCNASGPACWSCPARGRATRHRPWTNMATSTAPCWTTSSFAVLIFYVLTISGFFVLRRKRPDAERPYRAFGYPVVPALYIVAASAIMLVLLFTRPRPPGPAC